MGKVLALLLGRLVGNNLAVSRLGKTAGENIEAFAAVKLAISRWVPSARNAIEYALSGRGNLLGLPPGGEVLVPILCGWL